MSPLNPLPHDPDSKPANAQPSRRALLLSGAALVGTTAGSQPDAVAAAGGGDARRDRGLGRGAGGGHASGIQETGKAGIGPKV